ncbi:MAG: hypothetical protein IPH84_17805 [Bacteroidales bacterium]|nr:hypothetical protein [Bacteroidales bacterium]
MNHNTPLISWLLEGDVSIQYQVYQDLLGEHRPELQDRIATEGWGKAILDQRHKNGHWGLGFYQPKWTSTHYTLLELRNLRISPHIPQIRESIDQVVLMEKGPDGGINPSGSISQSDVCINGMFLDYACYFRTDQEALRSVIDFVLGQRLPDGGFNCRFNRSGAKHSSLHSTLSVAEGLACYEKNGYTYRLEAVKEAKRSAEEFMLMHHLFKSDKTHEIIHPSFLKFPYPARWKYDVMRALDYFRFAEHSPDSRMQEALDIIISRQNQQGQWKLNAPYPGKVHIVMEKSGQASRWNTLRALRIINYFCK